MTRRVLFAHSGRGIGGSIVSASLLARHISGSPGWEVVVALPGPSAGSEFYRGGGVDPEYYRETGGSLLLTRPRGRMARRLAALPRIWIDSQAAGQYLDECRPDIVHLNEDTPMLTWGWAARRRGIPVVWHIRQEKGNPLVDPFRLRLASLLIFVADHNRIRFGGRAELPPNVTIHNGVDLELFHPPHDRNQAKTDVGLDPERVAIAFVGNLLARKRPEWAAKAVARLLDDGRKVELVVAGREFRGGTMEERLKAIANDSANPGAFHFLGFRSDIHHVMQAADIIILPSVPHGEAFPRVVIEGMAAGAAVLATAVAGVPEAIDDGVTGVLCDPNDFEDFADKLRELTDDPDQRRVLGHNATRVVRERFSAEACAEKVMDIYSLLEE